MTGALTAVGASVSTGANPVSVTVDPSGRWAYVANTGSNNVSMFAIDGITGALTSLGAPVVAGLNPASITVDVSGRRAYVANRGSNDVTAFTIDVNTGVLTPAGTFVGVSPASGPVSIVTTGVMQ